MYPAIRRIWLVDLDVGSGGPGRGRIHIAAGRENIAHHRPETRTASCRLLVVEPVRMTNGIVANWTSTPEQYPIAIPWVDILVDNKRDFLATEGVISDCVISSWGKDAYSDCSGVGISSPPACKDGWFRTKSGKKAFKHTILAPKTT